MARLIPTNISPEVKSSAERKIFDALEIAPLEGYTCLHSLGLSRHLWKRQGEIDFVLVGQGQVLCLEVKGGRISRRGGVWCFTNRFGQESTRAESPFAQASSAMFSLKADIENHFGRTGYIFGYGVLMPDIEFRISSPEWDSGVVYDLSDTRHGFEQYVKRLTDYWRAKVGSNAPMLDCADLIQYLRGDFELSTPLWQEIQTVEEAGNDLYG